MAVQFSTFNITTESGLKDSITLEAPKGTQVLAFSLDPGCSTNRDPEVGDVLSVRTTRKAYDEHNAEQVLDLNGNPYGVNLKM